MKDTCMRVQRVKVDNAAVHSLKVMICDDEEEHIKQLYQLLMQSQDEISLHISTDTAPEKLLEKLENRVKCGEALPDVIFCDIRMPKIDGIAFGKALRRISSDIYLVFTTAYEEYAVEGYTASAFRYLMKPVSEEAVSKVLKEIQKDMGRNKKLVIKSADEERLLSLHDIIYLSAEDKYTVLYTKDGYFVDRTSLTEYEKLLEPYGFFRIHRKYIVNLWHHKGIGNGNVLVSTGERLPISRRRTKEYYDGMFEVMGRELLNS